MKGIRVLVAMVAHIVSFASYAADISKIFAPAPGVVAEVEIRGSDLVWMLSGEGGVRRGRVNVDAEKPLNIKIGSYDFSGRLGFLVSHVDDGMGVYEIGRVFTFSPSSNEFVERFPACGDEFVNINVSKRGRYLVSTYWKRGVPKRCITRLKIEK
ncbi:hypothetical protein [Burkholderia lata]|uniref:hypothetical protein n=1 Tax=Burkholderia lata (strain ATCC 17760 / DSM 23089 / LMG 22485 / NCIMB 9086 / R18194 / 383) TaxID=482957 RepID=UPI001583EA7E|nr:hypothetical protein [Burkholderia lata]